jgi:Tfp pilus assembly protein PilO
VEALSEMRIREMRWRADLRHSARHPWVRGGLRACALGAALLAASAAAWWPAQRGNAALETDIAAKRRTLSQTRQAQELVGAYAKAAKEVALLERKLKHAATQAQLVESFARLAARHGVKIVGETYDEGRGAAGQAGLSAELSVQGPYPALREFLRELSALPTWSEVQEVRLETARESGLQKGRIRIMTYRPAPERKSS